LLSIVNNTCSSLVAMEPQKKFNFWAVDFNKKHYNEHHCWKNDDILYTTCFLKWRCNRVTMDNTLIN
jgi:hypothetical protein